VPSVQCIGQSAAERQQLVINIVERVILAIRPQIEARVSQIFGAQSGGFNSFTTSTVNDFNLGSNLNNLNTANNFNTGSTFNFDSGLSNVNTGNSGNSGTLESIFGTGHSFSQTANDRTTQFDLNRLGKSINNDSVTEEKENDSVTEEKQNDSVIEEETQ